jgi:hypothetical protein
MAAADVNRPPASITLAGPPTNGGAAPQWRPSLSPEPSPTPRELPLQHFRRAVLNAGEPVAGDEAGPYAHSELVRMDNRFRTRLLRAFERGKESRQAAANRIANPRW